VPLRQVQPDAHGSVHGIGDTYVHDGSWHDLHSTSTSPATHLGGGVVAGPQLSAAATRQPSSKIWADFIAAIIRAIRATILFERN